MGHVLNDVLYLGLTAVFFLVALLILEAVDLL